LGVGPTTLLCKKIVEKPPRNSAIFNGRRLRRRPRHKLGCGAKEEEEEKKKKSERPSFTPIQNIAAPQILEYTTCL
jgi:hypothetical protein